MAYDEGIVRGLYACCRTANAQASSLLLEGEPINERFLVHANTRDLELQVAFLHHNGVPLNASRESRDEKDV